MIIQVRYRNATITQALAAAGSAINISYNGTVITSIVNESLPARRVLKTASKEMEDDITIDADTITLRVLKTDDKFMDSDVMVTVKGDEQLIYIKATDLEELRLIASELSTLAATHQLSLIDGSALSTASEITAAIPESIFARLSEVFVSAGDFNLASAQRISSSLLTVFNDSSPILFQRFSKFFVSLLQVFLLNEAALSASVLSESNFGKALFSAILNTSDSNLSSASSVTTSANFLDVYRVSAQLGKSTPQRASKNQFEHLEFISDLDTRLSDEEFGNFSGQLISDATLFAQSVIHRFGASFQENFSTAGILSTILVPIIIDGALYIPQAWKAIGGGSVVYIIGNYEEPQVIDGVLHIKETWGVSQADSVVIISTEEWIFPVVLPTGAIQVRQVYLAEQVGSGLTLY